jgi:hypothetical protein
MVESEQEENAAAMVGSRVHPVGGARGWSSPIQRETTRDVMNIAFRRICRSRSSSSLMLSCVAIGRRSAHCGAVISGLLCR